MTGKLPPNASVASGGDGAKMHAPAAARNAGVLSAFLQAEAPRTGHALEIASGTGQHVAVFADALPGLIWQPSDIDPARRASIDARAQDCAAGTVLPAINLDATRAGWSADHAGQALIVLVNLLHLISGPAAQIVVAEAMAALAPGGRFICYGPFRRDGVLTSAGDARFDADLRAADPAIGYKDDGEITAWLRAAGAAGVTCHEMPANNLAFVATRG
ncbi:DUF938 domain-containing protein [Roseobacter ponti]|uniref:DUF938 domain-containing protein n=1 Tax=Roseobacter ponti TaxID=1891787 RepID=A0A858SXW6_9RHOB|nr:DUF938 domain-containing protein [Roseobacter ponti]QJF52311.1 DUF938 domain-containing protein [Roseobacter ponti]